MSINRWMDKEDGVCVCVCVLYICTHTHNGILLSLKEEGNNVICSKMNAPRDYHIKWSKSNRERQISYDVSYVESKKNYMHELVYRTEIDSQTENRVIKGMG